jgi:hypothetical protein
MEACLQVTEEVFFCFVFFLKVEKEKRKKSGRNYIAVHSENADEDERAAIETLNSLQSLLAFFLSLALFLLLDSPPRQGHSEHLPLHHR